MSPRSVLITGCNRGLGLELVKQWLKIENPPQHVIGTYRDPGCSEELIQLAKDNSDRLHAIQFDVSKFESYKQFVTQVEGIVGAENGLNLLMNNAAYMAPHRALDEITVEEMKTSFEVNSIAPLFLAREFLPLLKTAVKDKSKYSIDQAAIIHMSTAVASISENTGGALYPYRSSKTALNQIMKSMSVDLKDLGILVMSMHPGWVQTRMGGPNALIDTETSIKGMIETLKGLTAADHGVFKRYNNEVIPW